MQNKTILTGPTVREELKAGVDALADVVKITMGPKGQNVLVMNSNIPQIINDGVSIAKKAVLPNALQNAGATLVKEVSKNTDDVAGDGTTTATVLAQAILNSGMSVKNVNYFLLKKQFDFYMVEIERYLNANAKKVKTHADMYAIAMVSTNGDKEVANILVDAVKKLGKKGYIVVKDSPEYVTYLKIVEGLRYDSGYISPLLTNDKTDRSARYTTDSLICYVNGELSQEVQVIPLLEIAASEGKPLLIISQKTYGEAMSALIRNKMVSNLPVSAVNCPGIASEQHDIMADMIAVTGGVILNTEGGPNVFEASLEDFGTLDGFEVHKDSFIVNKSAPDAEKVKERIAHIESEMKKYKHTLFVESGNARIAKLSTGLGVVYAGGYTPVEMNEKKLRIQDAINSLSCAIDKGYLPGGGVALLRASKHFKEIYKHVIDKPTEEGLAIKILCEAMEKPFEQIVINCGEDLEPIKQRILASSNFAYGYDGVAEKEADMYTQAIIDPLKVTVTALKSAIGIAVIVMSTGGAILEPELYAERNGEKPLFGSNFAIQ